MFLSVFLTVSVLVLSAVLPQQVSAQTTGDPCKDSPNGNVYLCCMKGLGDDCLEKEGFYWDELLSYKNIISLSGRSFTGKAKEVYDACLGEGFEGPTCFDLYITGEEEYQEKGNSCFGFATVGQTERDPDACYYKDCLTSKCEKNSDGTYIGPCAEKCSVENDKCVQDCEDKYYGMRNEVIQAFLAGIEGYNSLASGAKKPAQEAIGSEEAAEAGPLTSLFNLLNEEAYRPSDIKYLDADNKPLTPKQAEEIGKNMAVFTQVVTLSEPLKAGESLNIKIVGTGFQEVVVREEEDIPAGNVIIVTKYVNTPKLLSGPSADLDTVGRTIPRNYELSEITQISSSKVKGEALIRWEAESDRFAMLYSTDAKKWEELPTECQIIPGVNRYGCVSDPPLVGYYVIAEKKSSALKWVLILALLVIVAAAAYYFLKLKKGKKK